MSAPTHALQATLARHAAEAGDAELAVYFDWLLEQGTTNAAALYALLREPRVALHQALPATLVHDGRRLQLTLLIFRDTRYEDPDTPAEFAIVPPAGRDGRLVGTPSGAPVEAREVERRGDRVNVRVAVDGWPHDDCWLELRGERAVLRAHPYVEGFDDWCLCGRPMPRSMARCPTPECRALRPEMEPHADRVFPAGDLFTPIQRARCAETGAWCDVRDGERHLDAERWFLRQQPD